MNPKGIFLICEFLSTVKSTSFFFLWMCRPTGLKLVKADSFISVRLFPAWLKSMLFASQQWCLLNDHYWFRTHRRLKIHSDIKSRLLKWGGGHILHLSARSLVNGIRLSCNELVEIKCGLMSGSDGNLQLFLAKSCILKEPLLTSTKHNSYVHMDGFHQLQSESPFSHIMDICSSPRRRVCCILMLVTPFCAVVSSCSYAFLPGFIFISSQGSEVQLPVLYISNLWSERSPWLYVYHGRILNILLQIPVTYEKETLQAKKKNVFCFLLKGALDHSLTSHL